MLGRAKQGKGPGGSASPSRLCPSTPHVSSTPYSSISLPFFHLSPSSRPVPSPSWLPTTRRLPRSLPPHWTYPSNHYARLPETALGLVHLHPIHPPDPLHPPSAESAPAGKRWCVCQHHGEAGGWGWGGWWGEWGGRRRWGEWGGDGRVYAEGRAAGEFARNDPVWMGLQRERDRRERLTLDSFLCLSVVQPRAARRGPDLLGTQRRRPSTRCVSLVFSSSNSMLLSLDVHPSNSPFVLLRSFPQVPSAPSPAPATISSSTVSQSATSSASPGTCSSLYPSNLSVSSSPTSSTPPTPQSTAPAPDSGSPSSSTASTSALAQRRSCRLARSTRT